MLTKYFKFKVKTEQFINNTKRIIDEYRGKKVLICGDVEGFQALNKFYHFDTNFDIVAFANFGKKKKMKIRTITPEQIPIENYDLILVTGEDSDRIYNTIYYDLHLEDVKTETLFFEEIKDGKKNLEFLLKYNFERRLKSLKRRLKNKKIILYGAGVYLELIRYYFDLSGLNVIGIIDKKYKDLEDGQEIYGYKLYKPEQITEIAPDYIIITTKKFIPIWEILYFGYLEKTKIKILPILKRNFLDLICEIADS